MNFNYANRIAILIEGSLRGLVVTGSIARRDKIINDIDFVTKRNLNDIIDEMFDSFLFLSPDDIKAHGSRVLRINFGGINIDIWRAGNNYEYQFLKFMRDIDKGHNIGLRKRFKMMGYKLSDYGLYNTKNKTWVTFDKFKQILNDSNNI